MRTHHLLASPATEHRWTALPYGCWTCAAGREVLFNRFYTPIWQRLDGSVLAADPDEWVRWTSQQWFYSDGDIRNHSDLCRRLEDILTAFRTGADVRAQLQVGIYRASQARVTQKRSAA